MNEKKGICTAVIGSTTHATHAEEVLMRAAIRSRVVKVSSGARNGCIYGIELPCIQKENAEEVLRKSRIQIRQWILTTP